MNRSFDIDQITLEHFTNKSMYRKYLAKQKPSAWIDHTQPLIDKKVPQLEALFSQLLKNPRQDKYRVLQTKYEIFVEACLEHLDRFDSHMEDSDEDEPEEEEDLRKFERSESTKTIEAPEEMLFGECETLNIKPKTPIEYWKMQQVFKHPQTQRK
jgi:hypothetical protein